MKYFLLKINSENSLFTCLWLFVAFNFAQNTKWFPFCLLSLVERENTVIYFKISQFIWPSWAFSEPTSFCMPSSSSSCSLSLSAWLLFPTAKDKTVLSSLRWHIQPLQKQQDAGEIGWVCQNIQEDIPMQMSSWLISANKRGVAPHKHFDSPFWF